MRTSFQTDFQGRTPVCMVPPTSVTPTSSPWLPTKKQVLDLYTGPAVRVLLHRLFCFVVLPGLSAESLLILLENTTFPFFLALRTVSSFSSDILPAAAACGSPR